MDFQTIGLLSIVVLLVIVLLGCPVGVSMILVGFGGFALMIGTGPALSVLETAAWETATNYGFTLVPLFMLMGEFIGRSGAITVRRHSRDLSDGKRRVFNHFRVFARHRCDNHTGRIPRNGTAWI